MKALVVSLKKSLDRRAFITRECGRHGFDFEFVEAVDGGALTPEERRRLVFDPDNNTLPPSEVGCALSHLKAYRKMVDENVPVALIMEDDVEFAVDPRPVLAALDSLDASESVVYSLTNGKKAYLGKVDRMIGGFAFHKAFEFSHATGYVITRAAAKNLTALLEPIRVVADDWRFMIVAGALKAWVSETRFLEHRTDILPSTIAPERDGQQAVARERRRKRRFRRRVLRTLPFSLRCGYWLRRGFARLFFLAKKHRWADEPK